ncbi:methyl-CpG-binding protein 2-like [Dorcoceras hygrometricum]|uniref:Methyl-CpG-binding protein 2-like n=1 Tax=Dorcoceras hygrometricum TaxID=472368 RepID=A0A2Z7BC60_9LAMI|nr:methyl-CpG-binding protein 2-like [Dorcoceras hygrometricum]
MDLTVSGQEGKDTLGRDYRKGNWTIQETMVLIEAKKMDDERRMKRSCTDQRAKQAELRWKWVEDYCWRNGCFRSQNQCNDKWDNLMRDFKKVREYERRVVDAGVRGEGGADKSYWKIEKNERRENGLPSHMLIQIYEALVDVVEKKDQTMVASALAAAPASGGAASSNVDVPPNTGSGKSSLMALGQPSILPLPVQQQAPIMLLPLPPPAEPPIFPFSQPLPTVDSEDTSECSESPAKRRKKEGGGGGEAGTSGGPLGEIGNAISKSASIMAKAIQSREEADGRRHREVVGLHERRLQIEESKAEIKRQGMSNLVDAINKLADSIQALAANNKNQESFK